MRRRLSTWLHQLLLRFSFVRELYDFKQQYDANCNTYPGHFYSPVIDLQAIQKRQDLIWPPVLPNALAGIDMNLPQQLEWVATMQQFYAAIPYPETTQPGSRYYFENDFYSYTDAIMLYTFLRKLQPKQVIEIGSGFSSAAMLDAVQQLHYTTRFTFIDPYPDRLEALLTDKDKQQVSILAVPVQQVPLALFETLEAGDILFIDSSHVLKTDSDVHYNLFTILPLLKPGVFIHFHDIFYPFEYPKKWIMQGTNWNELYAVHAFLMHNHHYSIQCFSHYLHTMHSDKFAGAANTLKNQGGNLWLLKK